MNNKNKPELLSPAGRPEALIAAVQNGADAVYLGEKSFSARKNAVNFTWEEIRQAVSYCHVRGVKVHLAINTLINDNELPLIEKAAVQAARAGVDAVIVQDLGAAEIINGICPEMPMHASTQLTASCAADVLFLEKYGFTRVVLSRELTYDEIKDIRKKTNAELEAFVHGALCICFSGRCLMSSFIGGRSGNRGMCAQPCRQQYSADGKRGYFLSPKDLCLAGEIAAMKDAGITSFKIEGRMKSAEYVAAVTSVYRKYLDKNIPFDKKDEELLKKIFVRGDGFTKGYFCGINTPELMNYNISNDFLSAKADKGVIREMQKTFINNAENRKMPVFGRLYLHRGERAFFSLSDLNGNTAECFGSFPEEAVNISLTEKSAAERMYRMGGTPFEAKNITIDMEDGLMLSASELNRLRRESCAILEKKRAALRQYTLFEYNKYPAIHKIKHNEMQIAAQIRTPEQFESVKEADVIIVPEALWDKVEINEKCALLLPPVVLKSEAALKSALQKKPPAGVYSPSAGICEMLKEHGLFVISDFGLNIFNRVSARSVAKISDRITLSPELSLRQIKDISLSLDVPSEVIAYGKQTLMVTRACIIRGVRGKCSCFKPLSLCDKTGAVFNVYADKNTHLNTIVNSRPTFMADKLQLLKSFGIDMLRLVFTDESPSETKVITYMYMEKMNPVYNKSFTRGYFLK